MEVVNTADTTENKRLRSNDNKEESKSVVSRDHLLNFPIPGREGKSCIVKVFYYLYKAFTKLLPIALIVLFIFNSTSSFSMCHSFY